MLSATEEGKWVSYVYQNPESGSLGSDHTGVMQLKNAWVVSHDGLLFASGWYVIADEFTKAFVAAGVAKFREVGLEGTVEYFNSPGAILRDWRRPSLTTTAPRPWKGTGSRS